MLRAQLEWIRPVSIRRLFWYLLVAVIIGFTLFYHSGSAPAGLSPQEVAARTGSQSLATILNNPLDAPHKLVALVLHRSGFSGAAALRFDSALFAILFVVSFYSLAKSWFGRTVSLLSVLLFFGTPFLIIMARQASGGIMLLSPVVIIALYNWLLRTNKYKNWAWMSLMIAGGLFIYSPGLVWWLAGAVIISRQKIIEALETVPRWLVAAGLATFVILLIPAGIAVFNDWHLVRGFAAVPVHWRPPLDIVKSLVWMLAGLLVKMPYHSQLIIGRLPILNIIQIGLLVFGLYAMWSTTRSKTLALSSSIAFAILAAGINDNPTFLAFSLPAIAIFMAAGLRYLYIEWRNVFPSNPIPRSLALTLMICLVAAQLVYGMTYSLVAWPHSLHTKSSYVLK